MDSLKVLQHAIQAVFTSWEELARNGVGFQVITFYNTEDNRYLLQQVRLEGGRYESYTLALLEIRDEKIWILTDNTERGIATELVEQGVPKDKIVLGFYPLRVRQRGEFAAA